MALGDDPRGGIDKISATSLARKSFEDNKFLEELMEGYSLGGKGPDGIPNGERILTRSQAMLGSEDAIRSWNDISDSAMEKFMNDFFGSQWSRYDPMNKGYISATDSVTFVRELMGSIPPCPTSDSNNALKIHVEPIISPDEPPPSNTNEQTKSKSTTEKKEEVKTTEKATEGTAQAKETTTATSTTEGAKSEETKAKETTTATSTTEGAKSEESKAKETTTTEGAKTEGTSGTAANAGTTSGTSTGATTGAASGSSTTEGKVAGNTAGTTEAAVESDKAAQEKNTGVATTHSTEASASTEAAHATDATTDTSATSPAATSTPKDSASSQSISGESMV